MSTAMPMSVDEYNQNLANAFHAMQGQNNGVTSWGAPGQAVTVSGNSGIPNSPTFQSQPQIPQAQPQMPQAQYRPQQPQQVGMQQGSINGTPQGFNMSAQVMPYQAPQQIQQYHPAFQAGQSVNLAPLYSAVGNKPTQQFNLQDLKNLMDQQKQAGGSDISVSAPQYQTTQQLGSLVSQMQQMLAPYTQAQQNQATTGYNTALQDLDNKWAGRGLLASGGAASAEQQGANQLAQQLADIQGTAAKDAITNSFQYADLGLKENQQLFDQQSTNRNFDLQRAQQSVTNMLGGLNLQDTQLNDYLTNLSKVTGMDVNQNQWSQDYGQKQQAQDYSQWLQGQDLNQTNQKNYLDQWVQQNNTNLNADKQSYDQWMGIQNLGLNQSNQAFNQALQTADFGEKQKQDAQTNALNVSDKTGSYLPPGANQLIGTILQAKQNYANGDATQQSQAEAQANSARQGLASLGIDPAMFGSDVSFDQAYQYSLNPGLYSTDTLAKQAQNAQMTGLQPNGQLTWPALLAQAGQTGFFNGQATIPEQQMNLDTLFKNAQLANDKTRIGIEQQNADTSKQNANTSKLTEQDMNTYRNAQSQKIDQQMQQTQQTQAAISDLAGIKAGKSNNTLQDAMSYIQKNQQKLVSAGVNMQTLLNTVTSLWGSQVTNTNSPSSILNGLNPSANSQPSLTNQLNPYNAVNPNQP